MLVKETKAYWAKVIGPARPTKYNPDGEWSVDLSVTPELKKALKEHGLSKKIKNNEDDRGDYVTFRRKGKKTDGTDAKPIQIVDHHGEQWDGKTLIGNGSTVNASVIFEPFRSDDSKFQMKLMALQVWNLIKYKRSDFPTRDDAPSSEVEAPSGSW